MSLAGIQFRCAVWMLVLWIGAAGHGIAQSPWQQAAPGWQYVFPRDHQPHSSFKTEWWYFTGQLHGAGDRRFGFQVTFFRQGIRPPDARASGTSRFLVNDLAFGHFALSDVAEKRFRYVQTTRRGAFGEAGFRKAAAGDTDPRIAWLGSWELQQDHPDRFELRADGDGAQLHLHLEAAKPWIAHGSNGISQKAAGEGRASHYYSGTRLNARGTMVLDGQRFDVSGESWFDHEWASNQLTPEQAGWDWFSLQFDDGTELMLYQMRLRAGGADPHSSGTFIDQNGQTQHLTHSDYVLTPVRFWTSQKTGARYPVGWRIQVPRLQLEAEVETPLPAQELVLQPIAYWEGLIDVRGTREGRSIQGHGYLELTGYAGAIVGLSGSNP